MTNNITSGVAPRGHSYQDITPKIDGRLDNMASQDNIADMDSSPGESQIKKITWLYPERRKWSPFVTEPK